MLTDDLSQLGSDSLFSEKRMIVRIMLFILGREVGEGLWFFRHSFKITQKANINSCLPPSSPCPALSPFPQCVGRESVRVVLPRNSGSFVKYLRDLKYSGKVIFI